jgi:hypothetical protein
VSKTLQPFNPFLNLSHAPSCPVLVILLASTLQKVLDEEYKLLRIKKNYKVEEDEVGGTCGTNGGEEERV